MLSPKGTRAATILLGLLVASHTTQTLESYGPAQEGGGHVFVPVAANGGIIGGGNVSEPYRPVPSPTSPSPTATPSGTWEPHYPPVAPAPARDVYGSCVGVITNFRGQTPFYVRHVRYNPDSVVEFNGDDRDADGTLEFSWLTLFDDNARKVRMIYDDGHDGVVESVVGFEYGADGRLSREWQDYDNDGIIDDEAVHSYGVYGELLLTTRDIGADGTVDSLVEYQFDPWGFLAMTTHRSAALGDTLYTYEWDRSARVLLSQSSVIGQGGHESTVDFVYDASGRRVSAWSGSGLGATWVYDFKGRVMQIVQYGGGHLENSTLFSYDVNDRLTRAEHVGANVGANLTVFDYRCP